MAGNFNQQGCQGCGCCPETIVASGRATDEIDGVYTFHTAGPTQLLLCQDDDDGSSLYWGIEAAFSFTPDPGHPSVTQGALAASWAEHHTRKRHENCDCGTWFPDATGTWTVTLSHTGSDCCDAWHIGVRLCDTTCPHYP